MRAGLQRLLVLVSGQPDSWVTRCTHSCNQGRACTCETELANAIPPREHLVRSVPSRSIFGAGLRGRAFVPILPAVSGGPIPFNRRARRFMRALWIFLKDPKCRL